MDFGKEFEKFAVKDQGINSNYYNKIVSSMMPVGMTPNIIEERQMNAVAMDVFYGYRDQRPNRKYHSGAIAVFRKYRRK